MSRVGNLTVVGQDRTGVVARFTSYLFEAGANIEAIEERVRRHEFHMLLQASFGDTMDEERVARELAAIGQEMGMEVRWRIHHPGARRRAAILVTHEPHAIQAVLDAVDHDGLALDPVLVLGNHDTLRDHAADRGLPFHHIPWHAPAQAEDQVLALLDEHDVDLIILARFMRILSPRFVWRYPNRIINVHPSLLPAFPGASAYRQAWEHGVRVAGATAHFVTPDLDQGPILAQHAFPVNRDDDVATIKTKGQQAEAKVLVDALHMCLQDDLDVHWGRIW